jgi:predicted dehydrogenase
VEKALRKLEVPASCYEGLPATLDARAGNVARIYARMANDLKNGTRTAPSFEDAVELHRLLEAIETAAADGQRVLPKAPNRQLP